MNPFHRLLVTLQDIFRGLLYRIFFRRAHRSRARRMAARLIPHVHRNADILDIGSGTGDIADELANRRNARCVRLDRRTIIMHRSRVPSLLCDGSALAFGPNRFDRVLLVTVLHHCRDPEAVLAEAKRVCRGRIVVVEDIFTSRAERLWTIVKDMLLNLELFGHPRRFHSTDEWERIFADLGLVVEAKEVFRFRLLWVVRFRNAVYLLRRA